MDRSIVSGFVAAMALVTSVPAAELPSQGQKAKSPEAPKHCNVAGSPGVLAENGVRVRLSGYISAGFDAAMKTVQALAAAAGLTALVGGTAIAALYLSTVPAPSKIDKVYQQKIEEGGGAVLWQRWTRAHNAPDGDFLVQLKRGGSLAIPKEAVTPAIGAGQIK